MPQLGMTKMKEDWALFLPNQINANGEYSMIVNASRKLAKHEKNYSPFLLEIQASIWGMEHSCTDLWGRHLTLINEKTYGEVRKSLYQNPISITRIGDPIQVCDRIQ
jgi:hypothetical protein